MDHSRWERIQELFDQASNLPESERAAHLQAVCADDQELLAQVLLLLKADAERHSFLDGSPPTVEVEVLYAALRYHPPDEFHPYTLKHVLGEGGMGIVWLAERQDLRTQVAIKILRDGWFSPARQERFAAEQRTLAQLNHPFIARIYDASTLSDRTPWFAMEYVEGRPLTQYCSECNSSIEDRLQLFRAVCDAVQHAHSQAIIHRDLKPSNILVKKDGTVKLLDFGIAKQLTGADLTDNTRVMTLSYAAPEQVLSGRVGIQSDTYSLGVILYQLIAGRHPFDLSQCTMTEAESIVVHSEPEKPSLVHRRSLDSTSAPAAAPRLSKAAWNDLDAMCSKAMQKDLQKRYRSVEAFIRDLDHYDRREPLEARVPTVRYRFAKFLSRNRRVLSISGVMVGFVAVLIGLLLFRLAKARGTAQAEAVETSRIESFMLSLFDGGEKYTAPSANLRVLTLLDRGVREAQALNAEPDVQASLYQTLGGVYQKLGQFNTADKLLAASLQKRLSLYGSSNAKVADSLIALARLRAQEDRSREAETLARQALAMHLRYLPSGDPVLASDMTVLGQALDEQGNFKAALPMLQQAVQTQSRPGKPPGDLGDTLNVLGDVYLHLSSWSSAIACDKRAKALHLQTYGEIHPLVAEDLNNMAVAEESTGNRAEAEKLYRQALSVTESWFGIDHPAVAMMMATSAQNLIYEGQCDRAAQLLNSALAIRRKFFPDSDPYNAFILSVSGKLSLRRGNFDEAQATFRRVLDIYRTAYGEQHPRVGITLGNLGDVDAQRKNFPGAEQFYRDALDHFNGVLDPDHMQIGSADVRLGDVLFHEGRPGEAEPLLLRGHQILLKKGGDPGGWIHLAESDLTAIHNANPRPVH